MTMINYVFIMYEYDLLPQVISAKSVLVGAENKFTGLKLKKLRSCEVHKWAYQITAVNSSSLHEARNDISCC